MAHCGFEGTAVIDAVTHPLKALNVTLRGPRLTGPMAPDLPVQYAQSERIDGVRIPLTAIKRPPGSSGSAAGLR